MTSPRSLNLVNDESGSVVGRLVFHVRNKGIKVKVMELNHDQYRIMRYRQPRRETEGVRKMTGIPFGLRTGDSRGGEA